MTRKKKLVILLSAAVGVLLVALLIWLMCLPGIRGYREMAVEFYDAHRSELQEAQMVLRNFADENEEDLVRICSVRIVGEDYETTVPSAKRYGELYFITEKEYPEEVYQKLSNAVFTLFEDGLSSINIMEHQVRFIVKRVASEGFESLVVWTDGEEAPTGTYPTTQAKQQLDAHWFALVVSD